MHEAIGKPRNFPERHFTPATVRKRRWWIVAGVLVVGLGALAAYWSLRVCGNCSPILCDDPCTLPTFSQVREPGSPDASA